MNESHQTKKGTVVLVTGAAGYVGAMLVDQFSRRPDVARIVGLDKEELPKLLAPLAASGKLVWVPANTSDSGWEDRVGPERPTVVVHAAWQIRELYGRRELQHRWNIDGSDRVLRYAFSRPEVERLVHFSTVASYGAYPDNEISHRFTEDEPFRETDYLYATEKKIAEEHLRDLYDEAVRAGGHVPRVRIVRPASITGPRGRYLVVRVGLQSALEGRLKKGFVQRVISLLTSWVPVTPKWCRQFVHEDDVADIVERLAFGEDSFLGGYETFNLCPPGPVVTGSGMARAVGKRKVVVPPRFLQAVFFLLWHASRGRIPTSRGGWKSYGYPIAVDGSKVTRKLGYTYQYGPYEAFTKLAGRYAPSVTARDVPDELSREVPASHHERSS